MSVLLLLTSLAHAEWVTLETTRTAEGLQVVLPVPGTVRLSYVVHGDRCGGRCDCSAEATLRYSERTITAALPPLERAPEGELCRRLPNVYVQGEIALPAAGVWTLPDELGLSVRLQVAE